MKINLFILNIIMYMQRQLVPLKILFSMLVLLVHATHAAEESSSGFTSDNPDENQDYFYVWAEGPDERPGGNFQFFGRETVDDWLAILDKIEKEELLEFLSQWDNVGENRKFLLTNTSLDKKELEAAD